MFRISKEGLITIEQHDNLTNTGPINKTPSQHDQRQNDNDIKSILDLSGVQVDDKGETFIPFEIDDDTPEAAAARAFKTLARILQQAREEKAKRMEEEMAAAAKAEEVDIFSAEVKAKNSTPIEDLKPWILYPERKFRSSWDLFMTG